MIVLDEHLKGLGLEDEIGRWYSGKVVLVDQLRPETVVKDEAIPTILLKQNHPAFVTLNWTDFWRRVLAHRGYCIVCFAFGSEHVDDIPSLLRRVFMIPDFKTQKARMGKVVRVSTRQVQFYETGRQGVTVLPWKR